MFKPTCKCNQEWHVVPIMQSLSFEKLKETDYNTEIVTVTGLCFWKWVSKLNFRKASVFKTFSHGSRVGRQGLMEKAQNLCRLLPQHQGCCKSGMGCSEGFPSSSLQHWLITVSVKHSQAIDPKNRGQGREVRFFSPLIQIILINIY